MTLDEYTGILQQEIEAGKLSLAKSKKKLDLALRIKGNIEALRNSSERTLNRSRDDLSKSEDPVKQRLYDLPFYIAEPLIDKMVSRSMTQREYEMVLKGNVRNIVDYVEKLLFMRLIDGTGKGVDFVIASNKHGHFVANAYTYARYKDTQTSLGNLVSRTRELLAFK